MNNLRINIKNILDNVILDADSYKMAHFSFMQDLTNRLVAYVEARIGAEYEQIPFFGLYYHVKKYLCRRVTREMIEQAAAFAAIHGEPFNRKGWEYILEKHDGYFPLRIRAVEEGVVVPVGQAMLTVENTDTIDYENNAAFVATYVETSILRAIWYGSSVAARSLAMREVIAEYLEETGTPEIIDFELIDFGSRGVSSLESSRIGGAAHLAVGNMGTDNIQGILHSMVHYTDDDYADVTAFSIPATEHSVTTARGRENEEAFYSDVLDRHLGPGKMVSIVIDSYSRKNAVKIFGTKLKNKILEKGGTVRLRPDSGIPYKEVLATVKALDKYFGHTVNAKGYKVLHDSVRVIQGDGINIKMLRKILQTLKDNGYSADNVNFGCGGYLLQNINRDTNRVAMKGSYIEVAGVGRKFRKEPKTDMTKASKEGILELVRRDGKFVTVQRDEVLPTDEMMFVDYYVDGKVPLKLTFPQVRANVKKYSSVVTQELAKAA